MKSLSKILSERWVIPLLFSLLSLAIVILLIVRHQQQTTLNASLKILNDESQPLAQVEKTLSAVFISQNEFKEYTLTYDKIHLTQYRHYVIDLKAHLDTLRDMTLKAVDNAKTQKIDDDLSQRNIEAQKFFMLNRLTDSLIVTLAAFDSIQLKNTDEQTYIKAFTLEKSSIRIDTLDFSSVTKTKKRGLFGKIKSFLVGEEETKVQGKTVVKSNSTVKENGTNPGDKLKIFAESVIKNSNEYYQKQIRAMIRKRTELRKSEVALIHQNNALMNHIISLLDEARSILSKSSSDSRISSSNNIVRSSAILHNSLLITILIVLALTIALVYLLQKAITDRRKIEASEKQAVEESNEKSRFLAYMSHEFRCPVSLVLGYTEQLEQTNLSSEQQYYVSNLKFSSEILQTTVNDILDLSTLKAGKMKFLSEPFIATNTILKTLKTFENVAKDKHIAIKYQTDENKTVVIGDEIRLQQILNNLLSNAIKYTEKGEIVISSSIIAGNGSANLLLKVTDTGIGIAPEILPTIFDEYKRVHSESISNWIIGSGLGLSITKKLVENMQGIIEVSSETGKGSAFSVTLPYPLAKTQSISEEKCKEFKASIPDHLKILVADDNYFNINLLKTIFHRTTATLDFVGNGKDALKRIETGKYNLILSDLYMPEMNGVELTRHIRSDKDENIRNLPVIILSGNISPEIIQNMVSAGISDYLLKPYQQSDLFVCINKHVRSGKNQ
jgi:signal transduction histidine kinase/ActR/RegA family two-component response regulator